MGSHRPYDPTRLSSIPEPCRCADRGRRDLDAGNTRLVGRFPPSVRPEEAPPLYPTQDVWTVSRMSKTAPPKFAQVLAAASEPEPSLPPTVAPRGAITADVHGGAAQAWHRIQAEGVATGSCRRARL